MKLLDSDKSPSRLYLYLQPALGGALHNHLSRLPGHTLGEETVCLFAAELLLALAHIHSRGCVHRDVKASNCLLDERGHVKLCDFSAAKVLAPTTTTTTTTSCAGDSSSSSSSNSSNGSTSRARAEGQCMPTYAYTVIGTAEFMSPEMLLRTPGYSYATDTWSLGEMCVCIILLTSMCI
jgi:serine/threonine protein kinase